MPENTEKQPHTPSQEHERLNVFVGRWNTKGQVKASSSEPAVEITETDTYEWLPGGFFLIHNVDVYIGENEVKTIEIIGYGSSTHVYPAHSFDNQGNIGTFEASINDDIWAFAAESERATIVISDDGRAMKIEWERTIEGSNWVPWMEIALTKDRG